jgi:hypothetical protein
MMEFLDSLVGPMSKDWCYYFYWVAIFSLVIFAVAVINTLMVLFKSKKKFNFMFALNTVFTPLVSYLIARLYYNMCANSLQ